MSKYFNPIKISMFRKFMMAAYNEPSGDPTVGTSADLDVTNTLEFIDKFKSQRGINLTMTHLFLKMIGLSFVKYPELNCKISWGKIYKLSSVDVFLPVNLSPKGQRDMELGIIKINDLENKSLEQIASDCGQQSESCRQKKGGYMKDLMVLMAKGAPHFLRKPGTRLFKTVVNNLDLSFLGVKRCPFGSTMLTNVGVFGSIEGVSINSIGGVLPAFGLSSVFILGPVQKKVMAIDDKPQVRPMVHFSIGVDHRLIDGFKMFKYGKFWGKCLKEPEKYLDV